MKGKLFDNTVCVSEIKSKINENGNNSLGKMSQRGRKNRGEDVL
jgi:hypothetical protein